MPGTPRKISESGFYHVVVKGNNGRIMFEDDSDYEVFLLLMRHVRDEHDIRYHAWCLMSNHVHLLIEDTHTHLPKAMSALSRMYTEHYRQKYGHEGTLYTGRYWSEPIEDDAYALCAARYIHQNPQAAGICLTSQYRWSSIHEYLGKADLSTTNMLLDMCGGTTGFIAFHKAGMTATAFPGSKMRSHATDAELINIAKAILGLPSLDALASMPKEIRDSHVVRLHTAGMTNRQIARIAGLNTGVIQRALQTPPLQNPLWVM